MRVRERTWAALVAVVALGTGVAATLLAPAPAASALQEGPCTNRVDGWVRLGGDTMCGPLHLPLWPLYLRGQPLEARPDGSLSYGGRDVCFEASECGAAPAAARRLVRLDLDGESPADASRLPPGSIFHALYWTAPEVPTRYEWSYHEVWVTVAGTSYLGGFTGNGYNWNGPYARYVPEGDAVTARATYAENMSIYVEFTHLAAAEE